MRGRSRLHTRFTGTQLLKRAQQVLANNAAVWLDPSDLSTMRQDRTGASATIAAAVDSPVGSMRNKGIAGGWFTAPSDSARPILKQNYLLADGVDDWFVSAPLISLGEQWWHIGVWKFDDVSSDYLFTTSSETSGRGGLAQDGNNGTWWDNSVTPARQNLVGNVATAPALITVEQISTNSISGRRNRMPIATVTPFNDSALTQGLALMTRRNDIYTAGLMGRMYCGAWGIGSLSVPERSLLEQYIGFKSGITL